MRGIRAHSEVTSLTTSNSTLSTRMRQPYVASHYIALHCITQFLAQHHRHSIPVAVQHYLVIKITVQNRIIRHKLEASLPSLVRMEDLMLSDHSTAPRPAPGGTAGCSRAANRHISGSCSNRASKTSPKVSFVVVLFFRGSKHALNAVQHPA